MKRIEIPLRSGGVTIVINRDANQTWKEFYDNKGNRVVAEHHNVSRLDEEWLQPLLHCKVCKQPLTDHEFAWAFWKLQPECCSTECWNQDMKGTITKK